MNDRKLIGIGIAGVAAAAICCVTPIAVVALGVLGLSSLVGWIDPAVLAAAIASVGLIAYGVYRRQRNATVLADGCCGPADSVDPAKEATR